MATPPHPTVLLLPGCELPPAWMLAWRTAHGDVLVAQSDWALPLRGDWICRLEEAALAVAGPLLLAAHGLGCQLALAWGGSSAQAARVRAAVLVEPAAIAPGDGRLGSWLRPLPPPPFPTPEAAAEADAWPAGRALLLAAAESRADRA